ncbi:hypothetical protein KCP73_07960 [Salmonella enterica subsp. enterica]|nr:hypothetical protein KCP73_07960 [Salmonella enterica subsp. enterica]
MSAYGHPALKADAPLAGTNMTPGWTCHTKLENIAAYFREVRKKISCTFEGQLSYGKPYSGGAGAGRDADQPQPAVKRQNAADKLDASALAEIYVRGPPALHSLVTPTSRIVGTRRCSTSRPASASPKPLPKETTGILKANTATPGYPVNAARYRPR